MVWEDQKIKGLSTTASLEQIEHLLERDKYSKAWSELQRLDRKRDLNSDFLEKAVFYHFSAMALYGLGRFKESLEKGENAFQLLKNTTENRRVAQIQSILGQTYLALGRLKDAEEEFRDSVATCKRVEDGKEKLQSYNNLAHLCFVSSDYLKSIEYLKEAIPYLEVSKDWVNLSIMQGNLGRTYTLIGELDLAEQHLLSGIKIAKRVGEELRLNLSRSLMSLGYLKMLKREFKRSSCYLLRAGQLLQNEDSLLDLADYYGYHGELFSQEKKLGEAETYYKKVIEIAEKIAPQGAIMSRVCRLIAELEIERVEIEKASESLDKSLKISEGLENRLELGLGYRLLGEIHSIRDEKDQSRAAYNNSLNLLEETGAKYELIKANLSLSSTRSFDYQEKLTYLEKAKRLSSALGLKYFGGMAEYIHSQIELEHNNYENSLDALARAERAFLELGDGQKLSLCRELREQIENRLTEKSVSAQNEFKFFRTYFSGSNYRELQEMGLDESLRILTESIRAFRSFIASRNAVGEEFSFTSLINLEPDKAKLLLKGLLPSSSLISPGVDAEHELFKPIILTHPSSVRRFLASAKIASLLLIPLLSGKEVCGFVYFDRLSDSTCFSKKEIDFAVALADLIALKLYELQKKLLLRDNLRLRRIAGESPFPQFITQNNLMLKILWKLEQIKDTNLSVLLEGETGTGKDFLAKALHFSSNRKDKNLVPVNCAALPEPLLESELFGHKKGAYTGATFDKKGLFEEADGGTLYLDEIGDLSPSIQVKLLRALEEKVITRLGETKQRKIDIRIVGSTNKDLEAEVAQGRFRKDLYFRLNTVKLRLPPLRERKEDIDPLVEHFLKKHSSNDQKAHYLKPYILQSYTEYDWPGNVRELENETKRLLAYSQSGELELEDFLPDKLSDVEDDHLAERPLKERQDEFTKKLILRALASNGWEIKPSAKSLGIAENTLRYQLTRLKIKIPRK